MVETLTLRQAVAEDEAFLFDLYANTRKEELATWGLDQVMASHLLRMQFTSREATYRTLFPKADHHIILQDEKAAGRLLVDRSDQGMTLVDIALLAECRGKGLGSHLLKTLQKEAVEKGQALHLKVALDNPARRLYQRLGFIAQAHDGVYESYSWQGFSR